jgi:hypothetical protein
MTTYPVVEALALAAAILARGEALDELELELLARLDVTVRTTWVVDVSWAVLVGVVDVEVVVLEED